MELFFYRYCTITISPAGIPALIITIVLPVPSSPLPDESRGDVYPSLVAELNIPGIRFSPQLIPSHARLCSPHCEFLVLSCDGARYLILPFSRIPFR